MVFVLTSGGPAGEASLACYMIFAGREIELLLLLDIFSEEGGGQFSHAKVVLDLNNLASIQMH